jgi:hypothetical protein
VYYTDSSAEVINYVKSARVIYMWLPSNTFIKRELLPHAEFAIAFRITCQRPFHSASLAYAILQFSEANVRASDYCRFNLVSLCYTFELSAVVGILFYDKDFRPAFDHATSLAHCPHNPSFMWYDSFKCPISISPAQSIVENGPTPSSPTPVFKITDSFGMDLLEAVRYAFVRSIRPYTANLALLDRCAGFPFELHIFVTASLS